MKFGSLARRLARAHRELREVNRIGIELMHERELPVLLHHILAAAKSLTASDGGALFLADAATSPAVLTLYRYDIDSIPESGPTRDRLPIDDTSIAGHAARVKQPIVVADAYRLAPNAGFAIDRSFDEHYKYRRRSMLFVPMVDHLDHLAGLLVLVNRKTDPRARITSKEAADRFVVPYTRREVRLARALASQAAMAIENAQLYARIERTLESIVEVAVSAIDQRDPATAGHSVRVAELSTRLARAVNRAPQGVCRYVTFTARQLRELRHAALLHDVGKLVVPEAVLLKAKKLPPVLWERVAARFDLIRQTLELQQCRGSTTATDMSATMTELDQMLDVVTRANEGTVSEHEVSDELVVIAHRRLPLPDGTEIPYLTDEELHYLTLRQGTLDERERSAVEFHVEATYRFLKRIPWTDDLKNIAEYAYAHHEKLDGSGYPRHLEAKDIPVQARIITIADMFDALTQSDRPYKPALSSVEALEILRSEASAGRIDKALVDVLVQSRVYERAATRSWRRGRRRGLSIGR